METHEKLLSIGTALSFVMLCLATVLLLPPYEGFDETAHYSYVSFLADRGLIPNYRRTPLDATVEKDRQDLPRPYAVSPPFEENGGMTYHEFFTHYSASKRDQTTRRFWQSPQEPVAYTPGVGNNWQGQHPPLYYLLMALPYKLVHGWSAGERLLVLRLCSVLIACGSLIFWVKTIRLLPSSPVRQFLLLAGLTAVCFPSLPYEFGRLGNDSLVACLFAAIFYFLLSTHTHAQRRLSDFWWLGFLLGAGLLTKLFFVPFLLGVMGFTVWLWWTHRAIGRSALLLRILLVTGLPLLLNGWWSRLFTAYYGAPLRAGGFVLQAEFITPVLFVSVLLGGIGYSVWLWWTRRGLGRSALLLRILLSTGPPLLLSSWWFGLFAALLSAPATAPFEPSGPLRGLPILFGMARAAGGFATTFLWCGTWSWVRPSSFLYLSFLPLLLLTVYGFLSFLRYQDQEERTPLVSIALFFLIPLCLGFGYYVYRQVSISANGYIPWAAGYYLFCVWPVVGIMFAFSFEAARKKRLKIVLLGAFVLMSLFDAAGWWRSALVYSGIIEKVGSLHTGVGFLLPTAGNIAFVIDRLQSLVFPRGALFLYITAFCLRLGLVSWTIFVLLPRSWHGVGYRSTA